MGEHPVVACYSGLDSIDAVQLGVRFAQLLKQPLALASAYRYEPAALGARALPPPDNDRRAEAAEAALARARLYVASDVELRESVIPAADVAGSIIDLACDLDASVIVIGRDTEGHVTRSLLPRAPCPVAVAPLSVPLPEGGPIARIGIAYDGSPQAHWALVAAMRFAETTGAQLVVLSAGPTEHRAAASLQIARVVLHAADYPVTAEALVGDPARLLTLASGALDLLICGSRGRGGAASTILGSTSARLVAHARCPVLVVPPSVGLNPSGPLGVTSAAANA
jgi:nucleotide-binding universal stress UspA family protein